MVIVEQRDYHVHTGRLPELVKLQARDDWKAFLAKIQPLTHTQQNRILTPIPFSPQAFLLN